MFSNKTKLTISYWKEFNLLLYFLQKYIFVVEIFRRPAIAIILSNYIGTSVRYDQSWLTMNFLRRENVEITIENVNNSQRVFKRIRKEKTK